MMQQLTGERSRAVPISQRLIEHDKAFLDSPKTTERDVDDQFLSIQRLLERPKRCLTSLGEIFR